MSAILVTTRWGPMLMPPYDVYLSQAMIRFGEYAPAEFATWRPYIPDGATVVDVGANIGAHTLAFAEAVGASGSVIAVEPQWEIYAMLCGSIALCGARNTRARWCALGADRGSVIVPPINYDAQGNFGGVELANVKGGEPVPRGPLDDWNLPRVDFLKIDVEGMELDVLRGAGHTIKRCRPVLSVEADREPQVPALLEWLRTHEYAAWWHKPLLGPLWPNVVSVNLLGIPLERRDSLPEPTGDVEPA